MMTNIAIISDTHARRPSIEEPLVEQAERIAADPPDILIHLGDVGETAKDRNWLLDLYRNVECAKLLIPGNHDFWFKPYSILDHQIVREREKQLRTTAALYGWQWLADGPWVKDGLAIVGRMMGFDGTLEPLGRTRVEMEKDWRRINDGACMKFPIRKSEDPWSWYEGEALLLHTQLGQLDWSEIKMLVIATHYPLLPQLKHPFFSGDLISFAFGCDAYREFVRKDIFSFVLSGGNVRLIAGHTHGGVNWVDPDPEFEGRVNGWVNASEYCDPITDRLEV